MCCGFVEGVYIHHGSGKRPVRVQKNYDRRLAHQSAADIFSAKMPLHQSTFTESSYAFGVARLQLPGQMGYIGFNPGLMSDEMPTVAKGTPSRLILYHQGSLPGALSSIVMVPSLNISAVIMSNSLALNDCPDWIMQLLLERFFKPLVATISSLPPRRVFSPP